MNKFCLAASAAFLMLCAPAPAIVWRHDISEATVLNFGAQTQFQGIGMVNAGGGTGTGTFIGFGTGGNAWMLTAKHVLGQGQTGTFTFEDGRSYNILQTIAFANTDISIARLSSFATGVFLPQLNMSSTFSTGIELQSAGYGGAAPQGTPRWQYVYDNKRRGMQTRLDGYVSNYNFGGGQVFPAVRDRFLSPTTQGVRPIQGFGAPGDSGSPLMTNDGTILGVLSGGDLELYGGFNYYAALTPDVSQQIMQITGIPEPATVVALGFGALAMMRRRRKS